MTKSICALRARWRETVESVKKQIIDAEECHPLRALNEDDPAVANAAWILKLKAYLAEVEELLETYPGD